LNRPTGRYPGFGLACGQARQAGLENQRIGQTFSGPGGLGSEGLIDTPLVPSESRTG
jgi:hypothetical protein